MQESVCLSKIIAIESSFNPNAYNPDSGAVGLMQITEPVLRDYNLEHKTKFTKQDLTNPTVNIMIGTWYLDDFIPRIFHVDKVPDCVLTRIIAFNWGAGNLKKWYFKLPSETIQYIAKYEGMIK